MSRSLSIFPSIALMVAYSGCSASEDKQKDAVLRVLRADDEHSKQWRGLPQNAPPSKVARSLASYCSAMEQIDTSDCPADFRVAYTQHIRAWRDVQAAVAQLPDGFLDGFFMGLFNGVVRRELDGGANRLEGNLNRAIERVRATWEEVEKIGAKYGAAI